MSEQQQGFFDEMSDLASAGRFDVYVETDNGFYPVGSHALGAIDVGDMSKGESDIITPQSLISHELREQKTKQVDRKNVGINMDNYAENHKEGEKAEKRVTGAERLKQLQTTSISATTYPTGHYDFLYNKGGVDYNVIMNVVKGNVTDFQITPIKKK